MDGFELVDGRRRPIGGNAVWRLHSRSICLRGFPTNSGNAGLQCAAGTLIPGLATHETGCNKPPVKSTHASCAVVNWRSLLQKKIFGVLSVAGLRRAFQPSPPPPSTELEYSIILFFSELGLGLRATAGVLFRHSYRTPRSCGLSLRAKRQPPYLGKL